MPGRLYQVMHQRLLQSRVVHGGDSLVKLCVAKAERTSKAHYRAVYK
jgi:hypothetical protein